MAIENYSVKDCFEHFHKICLGNILQTSYSKEDLWTTAFATFYTAFRYFRKLWILINDTLHIY